MNKIRKPSLQNAKSSQPANDVPPELDQIASRYTAEPKKRFTPISCFVALHIYAPEETASGLVVPTDRDGMNPYETTRCKVIAVGPDCKQVKEGDEVLCGASATLVIHKGDKYAVTREDHLIGIVIADQ